MKHLLRHLLLLTGLVYGALAAADDYQQVATPIPQQADAGKVVVQQFLWHQCIHCYHLEPDVQAWLDNDKPDFVDFERVPVAWSDRHLAQGAFYTLAKAMHKQGKLTLADLDTINDGLFDLHFVQKKPLVPDNALPIFKPYGITDVDQLTALLDSQPARDERRRAHELTTGYQIAGVPVFVVNGKYLVSFSTLEGEPSADKLFAAINRLAEQERQHP